MRLGGSSASRSGAGSGYRQGDVRHQGYTDRHGENLWVHGSHNYERGVLARSGSNEMSILLNASPEQVAKENMEIVHEDGGEHQFEVLRTTKIVQKKSRGPSPSKKPEAESSGWMGLKNVISQDSTPQRSSGKLSQILMAEVNR
jgi:hypothetical protein